MKKKERTQGFLDLIKTKKKGHKIKSVYLYKRVKRGRGTGNFLGGISWQKREKIGDTIL